VFDVYVDGATGTSREAVRELAGAMAARYRLPAAELEARLTRGRFRVKAGVDRATAEAYLRDLAAIGARVRIEPAGEPAGQPAPPEPQATRASLPPQRSPLPPPAESRAMRSSLPPQSESRPAQPPPPPPPAAAESRAMRSSLPPQTESRTTRSSLSPQTESRATRSSLPPQTEARAMRSSLPPQTESRPARSSLPPSTGSPLPPASGGSPGRGGVVAATGPIATLGALDRSGALSLATLDDEPAQAPSTDGVLPASMGPAAPRPARPARSRSEPVDPFAPPELAVVEPLLELALADDDVAHRARKQASALPAMAGEPGRPAAASNPPAGPPRASPSMAPGGPLPASSSSALAAEPGHRTPPGPSAGLPPGPVAVPSALPSYGPAPVPPAGPPRSSDAAAPAITVALRRLGSELVARIPVLASARVRLVAGVALAIALGFVPAHLVGGIRERSAFAAIDAGVVAVQSTADTPDSYAALDAFRAEQLEAKYGARRSIAVTALLVWAAVGAALAFGWFALFRSASAAPRAPDPVTASPGTREVRAADK
jgi:hypothetical protein